MNRSEDQLQATIAIWLDIQQKMGWLLWYAIPNTARRSPREGARFKRMGVKAGVSDIAIVFPNGRAAFIELKSDKGKLSQSQKDFLQLATKLNAHTAVCRSLDEVCKCVMDWRDEMRRAA